MSKHSFVLIAAIAVAGLLAASSRASNPEENRERAKQEERRRETAPPPARRFDPVPPEDRPTEQFRAPREHRFEQPLREHHRRLTELREELERLHLRERELQQTDGSEESLHQIRRQIEIRERHLAQLERELDERNRDRFDRFRFDRRIPPDDRPADNPEFREIRRRLMHLHVAIENLHRAEFHEVAQNLSRQAEQMERELRRIPENRREHGVEQRPPQSPPIDEFRRMFEEMRGEIEQLRNEVRDLRKAVTPKQDV